jgi:hypothetical protein
MKILFDPAPEKSALPDITNLLSHRNKPLTRQQVIISGTIGLLAITVVICAGLVAVPLWSALAQSWQTRSECSVIKDAWARQACYKK